MLSTVCFMEFSTFLLPLTQVPLDCTVSRSCSLPFWSDGPEDTVHRGWGCDSAPCLWVGKLGSKRAGKTPHLRIQMRQVYTPLSFLVRVFLQLGSALSKATGWHYYLSTTSVNLICQDLCCKPLPPSSQISSGWVQQRPLQFLWSNIRVEAPIRQPTMLCVRAVLIVPAVFSLPAEETRGLEENSVWCRANLGRGSAVNVQPLILAFLYSLS